MLSWSFSVLRCNTFNGGSLDLASLVKIVLELHTSPKLRASTNSSAQAIGPCQEIHQRRPLRHAGSDPAYSEPGGRIGYGNVPQVLAQLGGKTLSSIGLARATLHLNWKAATYNLRRFVYLLEIPFVSKAAHGAR